MIGMTRFLKQNNNLKGIHELKKGFLSIIVVASSSLLVFIIFHSRRINGLIPSRSMYYICITCAQEVV